jgi:hypothetical protein
VKVTFRAIPGALAMGLVAALLAHAAVFGGGHAMGGAYHGLLLELSAAAMVAMAGAAAVVIRSGARFAADGSILAARIVRLLPSLPLLVAASAGWFALGECIEPRHDAAPIAAIGAALILAAALLLAAARAVVGWFATAVVAIVRFGFAGRRPAVTVRPYLIPLAIPAAPTLRRRFARPPPTIAPAR